jgi:hemerythrin-like domain-containing protein
VALAACVRKQPGEASANADNHPKEGVTPPEDLMREHAVLNRVLLIYEESADRLEQNKLPPIDALKRSADIIQRFIEQYHERLEEDFLFPQFENAGKLVDLVGTLRRQHQAGRVLTAEIIRLCNTGSVSQEEARRRLVESLRAFSRMYRPHEAREDTVLFPALRGVISDRLFNEFAEQFEDKEHALFGKQGFEGIVAQVEDIERTLGVFDLNQFTPAVPGKT